MKWIIRIRTLERETLGNVTSERIDTIETREKPVFLREGVQVFMSAKVHVLLPWWRVLEVMRIKENEKG